MSYEWNLVSGLFLNSEPFLIQNVTQSDNDFGQKLVKELLGYIPQISFINNKDDILAHHYLLFLFISQFI